jgi:flagellar biosynthesis protein FlhF
MDGNAGQMVDQTNGMDLRTYRARSMQDALRLVRADLGPDAAVLHTRELRGGLWKRLLGVRQIEVTASPAVNVPSRFAERQRAEPCLDDRGATAVPELDAPRVPPVHGQDYREEYRDNLKEQLDNLQSLVEQLCQRSTSTRHQELPESLFHLFTELIDQEVSEELARELIERVRQSAAPEDLNDPVLLKARIARMIEEEIQVQGPLRVVSGQRRLVALVGPTGVGKTTTIAKLAANFHLREKCRVGLITVDTYRIAAVEQLRTYADIIDLPMEVVSSRSEMRQAVDRLAGLDLILMDTAGRSPRDEVKIQELRDMLTEAEPDEVHLVLSSVNSVENLKKTARRFAGVGVSSLVLTKLDEATGLGGLLPLLRCCRWPLSYVTNGQNVPDDIAAADGRQLAQSVLGVCSSC